MKFVVIALFALACVALANDASLTVSSIDFTSPTTGPVQFVRKHNEEMPDFPPENFDIATLVTIGKTVWEIIKEGKPVVNYKNDWAGAIPKGAAWTDVVGFKDYRWGPFGWSFTDMLGMETVRFTWNFMWSCKGSYEGHGAFIMNAGASIKEIYAAWGFTVDVNIAVDSHPINYGTKVDPVAGLAVQVTLDVRTVLQAFTERCRVSLRGDCTAAKISC